MTNALGVVAAFFGSLVIWHITSTIIAWHRLRHVPGPLLASLTYLWVGRVAYGGKQAEIYTELDKNYGKLVRIGPNDLTTSHPDVVRTMSSTKSKWAKSSWIDGNRFNPYHATMFMVRDPIQHDRKKARLMPGYSGRDTTDLEKIVDEQIAGLLGLIRRKYLSDPEAGVFRTFQAINAIGYFALDVISHVSLGTTFGCLETDSDPQNFYSGIGEYMPRMGLFTDVPWIRNVAFSKLFLKFFGPRETDSGGIGRLMKFTNEIVRSRFRLEEAKGHGDMLSSFIRHGLTQQECEVETLFMFVAGSDTTASVIRMTLLHIVSCPRIYQRLKAEIRNAVREGAVSDPITNIEARKLPYLQAVIYEGLRFRPATTAQQAREVPPEGETIDGKFIPGGTSVAINFAAISRSRELFGEDADVFRPERFLGLEDEGAEMRQSVELMFGYGRYICAGKPIALMELNKVYFELLRAFEFELLNPEKPVVSESYVLFRDHGLQFRVTQAEATE